MIWPRLMQKSYYETPPRMRYRSKARCSVFWYIPVSVIPIIMYNDDSDSNCNDNSKHSRNSHSNSNHANSTTTTDNNDNDDNDSDNDNNNNNMIPVKTLLLREPLPCNAAAAESALQPLIWCFSS